MNAQLHPDIERLEIPPGHAYDLFRGTRDALIAAGLANDSMFPKPPKLVSRGTMDTERFWFWRIRRIKGGRYEICLSWTPQERSRAAAARATAAEYATADQEAFEPSPAQPHQTVPNVIQLQAVQGRREVAAPDANEDVIRLLGQLHADARAGRVQGIAVVIAFRDGSYAPDAAGTFLEYPTWARGAFSSLYEVLNWDGA